MSLPYLDQFDPERRAIFKNLAVFAPPFVLAGGTAIMLQIGHRRSYDFDCFCEDEELSDDLYTKIRRAFGNTTKVRTKSSELLTLTTQENIEITFVCHPYAPLRQTLRTSSLPLFHLDDLAANKAYTLGRRPAWRDYVDLFFLLTWKRYALDSIIKLAEKKFKGEFNAKLFLQQLTYYGDIEIVDTAFLKESYTPDQMKAFLEREVRAYLQKALPGT